LMTTPNHLGAEARPPRRADVLGRLQRHCGHGLIGRKVIVVASFRCIRPDHKHRRRLRPTQSPIPFMGAAAAQRSSPAVRGGRCQSSFAQRVTALGSLMQTRSAGAHSGRLSAARCPSPMLARIRLRAMGRRDQSWLSAVRGAQ
jgi:hypothetical protein